MDRYDGFLINDRYKAWFDLSVILISHVILFPIWLLLWLAIPLMIWAYDQGPIFYKQKRSGKNGTTFTCVKFRTMREDAEAQGPSWTVDNDPRITPVGRILRKSALDELPELICIVKRDMSLVGPRALDVAEQRLLENEIPGFSQRLAVAPGLTGLAQVYNQEDVSIDKLNYDLEYIQRMNVWLDLSLIILSIRNTLFSNWDKRSGKTKY